MSERLSLPSASSLKRLALCPGSHRLSQDMPDTAGADAAAGTRIHARIQEIGTGAPPVVKVSPSEEECAQQLWSKAAKLRDGLMPENAFELWEERMWMHDGFVPIFSGQPDAVWIHLDGKRALIVDFKSGWGGQDEAADNHQLMALAVLLWIGHAERLTHITCALVTRTGEPTLTEYDRIALECGERTIRGWLKDADKPDAPLNPSADACRWCRAKAICPAIKRELATMGDLAVIRDHDDHKVAFAKLAEAAESLTADDLAQWLNRCTLAEMAVDAIRAEAKRRLEAGGEVPGWTLKDGASRRTVTDAQAAYAAVGDKMTPGEFAACCTVKIGELDAAFKTASGMKAKDAKDALAARLGSCLEVKRGSSFLVRIVSDQIRED